MRREAAELLGALPSWGREAVRWAFAAVAFHAILQRREGNDVIGLGNLASDAADELMTGLTEDVEAFDPDAPIPFTPTAEGVSS